MIGSTRHQPLVVVLAGASAGIVCDRFLPLSVGAWFTLVVWSWFVWLLAWRRGQDRRAQVALLLSVLATAAAWHHFHWYLFPHNDLSRWAREEAQPVCVEVVALDEPSRIAAPPDDPLRSIPAGDMTRVLVEARTLRDGQAWRPVAGRVTLLVNGHLLGMHAGDRLQVFAQLVRPRAARNPLEFCFARHARADRRMSELHVGYPDAVTRITSSHPFSLTRGLARLRSHGNRVLARRLTPNHAALAAAVLLGERSGATSELTDPFFMTGMLHVLVVSGLHVGILASVLHLLLKMLQLPRRATLVLAGGLIVCYAILTGAQPPAVRAATLFVIFYAAQFVGQRAIAYNSLAAAALIVLALNPADLFRAAPQLSFLAVAVLMWAAGQKWSRVEDDPLKRLIAESRPWPQRVTRSVGRFFWQMTLAGALVWLVTLPLVMNRFHLFTPTAIFLTPLVWPLICLCLLSGLGLLLLDWLLPPLAELCAWLCNLSLGGLQACVDLGERLPGSYLWVAGPDLWWIVGFYGALALAFLLPDWKPPRRGMLAALAAWTTLGLGATLWPRSPTQLDCQFVALDHGTSVVVRLPTGQTLLYDAGRLGDPDVAVRAISGTLWAQGVTHLDAVVLSHADADHYNALPELLRRFSVGVVYVSPVMFEEPSAGLEIVRATIAEHDVPLRTIWLADRLLTGGGVTVEVRHPPPHGVLGGDNANSIVLAVEFAGRRMFLPGDLEAVGMIDVLAESPYHCDVLMAPHHGSRRSDPPGFAAWSTPDWVIISSGHKRDLEPTSTAYRAHGAKLLTTATHGAVHVRITPKELTVETWRRGAR